MKPQNYIHVASNEATLINGVNGFDRRGKPTLRIEGITVNYPLVIEVVDE
jgi:PII-like signaling protein